MNRKDTQNKGYNQKGYQDRQQNPQGGNQGNQNRNTNYNNTYNDRPRTQGGYKNNYEETKQQTNAKPATSTAKPAQNTANAAQDTNFREEFKEFFEEVKQFETKMDAFKKNPKSTDGYYYLLSNKAMKEWKEYLDYANITADKKPYISISRKPNKVNEDMVLEDKSFLQYPDKTHPCGVVIKPDLEKDKDFIIVNEDVWIFFKGKYGGLDIMRKGAVDEQGNITLVKTMHVVTLIIMYSTYLKSLENNKNDALRVRKLQVPLEFTVKAFKQQMAKIFNKLAIFKYNIESGCLRIWQMDPKFPNNEEFRAYLHDCCVKSRTYDYQIQFDGKLLDREPSAYLEEINPEMKDALVIEINQPGKLWIFFNEYVKACKKCVFCGKIDFLDFECICGQVAYCSEHCKYSDKGNHVKKCEKAYDSDENKEVATVTNPIDGLAGLENLGNTCYMNSAIQCLSNIKELTEHFLNQKYKQEINEQNPLGTKGKIVRKYAYLVKKLWLDNKREFAPYSLKLAVSKFQTMFHGQNQHDSQEFLFYLLDTIHEDLNRVIQKPLTDPIEAGSKSDLVVGRESWEVFLKRNQSIVVDLMYGQFKSTIECLACRRASKSFESFSICSIPIPNQKEIEVFFVHENHKKKPYRILLKYPDNKHTLLDLKHDLAFLLEKQADSIQLAVGDRNRVQPQYDLNVTTYEFSHQLQKNYLFAFELTQEEQRIPQNRRVFVGVQTLKADLVYEPKESMGVVKVIAVDTNMTNKEVHLKIFNKYRFMFDERWPYKTDRPYDTLSLEQACDEAFARSKKPIYEVVITRVGIEKEEEGVLEYNDDKFTNVLKLFEDPEKQLLLQVEWKSIPSFIELEYFRSFIKYDPYKGGINNKTNDEKKFIDISDCLSCFAEPEELDENNAWYCKNCSKHQNAKKVLELYKVPQIFILHLKRFKTGDNTRWNRTESKITDLITFPVENFDLSPYVTNPHLPSDYFGKEAEANGNVDGKKELQYDLIGVIHHIGNLNSGHYIAHCKNVKTGEWFAYDDERVRKIENLSEIVVNTAYILFYRRK